MSGTEAAPARPLVLGTAGHIDHGKTALVGALTGKDTDRLPEEKERGISIELGYAPLELPGGQQLSVVDVPGHERFVRTMVAGATGIDLFLLVVDAREGAKPQTHEHLAIIRLLGIRHGVVAVTKSDLLEGDPAALDAAVAAARELVPESEAVAVSARTGAGLDALRDALARAAAAAGAETAVHASLGATRLFVDRSFSLRGVGTVVTGTLWSGSVGGGDLLRVEPRGLEVRVRSVQVHDRPVERADAGQRVALALPGIERTEVGRGDVLVAPGIYPVSYRVDVELDELEPVAHGQRVQVHHGTVETVGRIVRAPSGAGDAHLAQLRIARPLVAARGDRIVLRGETTLAGARVLDPAPARRLDPGRLDLLATGSAEAILRAAVTAPVPRAALRRRGLLRPEQLEEALAAATAPGGPLVEAGAHVAARAWLDALAGTVHSRLAARAAEEPLDPGLPVGELLPGAAAAAWAADVLPLLGLEQRGGKAYAPGAAATLSPEAAAAADELLHELEIAESGAVPVTDDTLARHLEAAGQLVRVGDGMVVARATYDIGRRLAVEECQREGRITLARFRDLVGTSRRVAQLLLERFDADGVTRRIGDERVLRRAAREGR
jgi:selenocysteine-specific elongation factor